MTILTIVFFRGKLHSTGRKPCIGQPTGHERGSNLRRSVHCDVRPYRCPVPTRCVLTQPLPIHPPPGKHSDNIPTSRAHDWCSHDTPPRVTVPNASDTLLSKGLSPSNHRRPHHRPTGPRARLPLESHGSAYSHTHTRGGDLAPEGHFMVPRRRDGVT
jgi:hypothetical protein